MSEFRPTPRHRFLTVYANAFFSLMGAVFSLLAVAILLVGLQRFVQCLFGDDCDTLNSILVVASYLIIAVAIFDVGRYLLEEEVFRDRELRSPREARRSLTKFMVIIVIAVTLESLIAVIRAGTGALQDLLYPAALFFVATTLLVGLGLYQRLSVMAEQSVEGGGELD